MDLKKPDNTAIAAVAAFLVIIILAATQIQPMFSDPKVVIIESPLEKNAVLSLDDGETFNYSYISENSTMEISYTVEALPSCMLIIVAEANDTPAACLGPDGEGSSSDAFDEPAILLFRPWMLALRDGWRWNTSMFIVFQGTYEHVSDTEYRVVRRDIYEGRDAFVVEVKSSLGDTEYDWVDAKRRILLRSIGDGYEVVLKNADNSG